MSKRPLKNNGAGFTLVEVVISVAILGLILTTAYSSLEYIIRSKKILDDRREIAAVANAVLLRLSREIQLSVDNNLVPPETGYKPGDAIKIEGVSETMANGNRGDSLRFMAQEAGQYVPEGLANTGAVMIRYRVEKDPDSPQGSASSYQLIRDEVPDIRPPKKAWEQVMTFPIAKNVTRLEFAYYESNSEKWLKDWGGAQNATRPSLVRMILALKSPAGLEHEFVTVLPMSEGTGRN